MMLFVDEARRKADHKRSLCFIFMLKWCKNNYNDFRISFFSFLINCFTSGGFPQNVLIYLLTIAVFREEVILTTNIISESSFFRSREPTPVTPRTPTNPMQVTPPLIDEDDHFWILCDVCHRWYHGRWVKIMVLGFVGVFLVNSDKFCRIENRFAKESKDK